jgi:ribonuclease HIII
MNATRVFAVDAVGAERLAAALRDGLPPDAEWRQVAHARFAVKALGCSLVCYTSGKVVVQGSTVDAFVAQFLADLAAADAPPPSPVAFDGPTIGSDEAGKGDYFGPLVVAAVYAEPAAAAELSAMGVADSKRLSDLRMFPMAELLERRLEVQVRALPPPEYNARWRADPNVNHVLAELHADAVATLLLRHPEATVVVDRFGDERLVAERLQRRGASCRRLVQVPRAEAHPVVAAASIVARVHFLEGLKRCEEDAGTPLHKGAGEPVDQVAREVLRIGGRSLLARIAKLHFKNSDRIGVPEP